MPPEWGSEPSSTAEYERARARVTQEVNAAVEDAPAFAAADALAFDSAFRSVIEARGIEFSP